MIFGARALSLCLALAALPSLAVAPPKGRFQNHVPGELIVRFRPEVREFERDAQMLRLGAQRVATIGRGRQQLLKLDSDADLTQAIARLQASGLVEYAHPNFYRRKLVNCAALAVPKFCPNDPDFVSGLQYHLHNQFTVGANDRDADIDMPQAWNLITGSSVLLAIIDDGFDLTHADLAANFPTNGASCTSSGCSGTAAAVAPTDNHGTFVAGSAAAVGNNSRLGTGVLLSANVLPLRMPNYTTVEVIESVDYAIAQGARVINMSFGGVGFTATEFDAIDRARTAGILVVAAAGNEDSNTDKAVASYPANYALDNIIAAGASDVTDQMASFSTWGSFTVDIAAPGVNILTTARGDDDVAATVSGTSFSAPITAGAAALVGQYLIDNGNTTWNYQELKARLLAGADNAADNGDLGLRGRVAAGRLNVRKSLDPISGGVLVVQGVTYDDNTGFALGNDADGQPDPGETLNLVVTIENAWQAAGTVAGTLSTVDTDATVTSPADIFPSTAAFGTSTAEFTVVLGSFTTNEQILFRLDLVPQTGAVQTRYFFVEVGALSNGVEKLQQFQRTDWDEFHAWHVNVPAGATNVVFETHSNNSIDIDLIARRINPPAYFAVLATSISTGGGTGEACDISDPCIISGEADGEELIGDPIKPTTDIVGTEPGTWHLVVVNFDQISNVYRVKASWDAGGAGTVRFSGAATATNEAAGNASLQVVRSGGVGAVSVNYSAASGTASSGSDFTSVNGTLNWANGDLAPKSILVPITADTTSEAAETFTVTLDTPTGGADIGRHSVNTVTIASSLSSASSGGGGGATDALLLAGLAALLAARHRRTR